jgi:hypothetical protein
MSTQLVTSFEVLAQPIAPGVPAIPYVEQGSFLQITNLGSAAAEVQSFYVPSPAFVASNGAIVLTTNYIDGNGKIKAIPSASFLETPVGFGAVSIPVGATFLFGVQYVQTAASPNPALSQAARGIISLSAPAGTKLLVLPTIRQVFTNYNATTLAIEDVAEAAYAVPTVGGPVISF